MKMVVSLWLFPSHDSFVDKYISYKTHAIRNGATVMAKYRNLPIYYITGSEVSRRSHTSTTDLTISAEPAMSSSVNATTATAATACTTASQNVFECKSDFILVLLTAYKVLLPSGVVIPVSQAVRGLASHRNTGAGQWHPYTRYLSS